MADDDGQESQALGVALAGSLIAATLLEELVQKNLLSVSDVRGILQKAQNRLVHFYGTDAGRNAGRVIASLFTSFPEEKT